MEQKASARNHWRMEQASFPKAWLAEHSYSFDWEGQPKQTLKLKYHGSQEMATGILCRVRNDRAREKHRALISTGSCGVLSRGSPSGASGGPPSVAHRWRWAGWPQVVLGVCGGRLSLSRSVLCGGALPSWRSWCCRVRCAKYPSAISSVPVPRNRIN